ncbi:MAG: hypothetical protein KDD56_09230, partial [Bdellovibrionales bacterium]|nr:hypothetical protein [Bdellovibrionales bacterium]
MPERADRSLRQRDSQARDHQDLADPASSLPSTNRHDVLRDTGIRHTYTGPITSFGVSPETHTVDYNVIRATIDITPGAVTYDYGVGANYRDLLQSRTMESLAQKLASGRDLTKEELNFLAKTSPNDSRSWQSFHHSMMLHADSQTFTRALNPEELRQ